MFVSERGSRERLAHGLSLSRPVPRSTFTKLRADPREGFPQPINVRGRLFWRTSEIDDWLMSRPKVSALPSRRQNKATA